jgi:hypothetical protein
MSAGVHLSPTGLSPGWIEFLPQPANPGVVPANTLYQDDGTNYIASTLVWDGSPSAFATNFAIGPVGFEQGGILVQGVNFDATAKVNDIGGALDAMLILHRHSATVPANLVFARTNDDTAAHTAVTPGQTLSSVYHMGWSGTHYDIAARIDVITPAGGTVSPTSLPGQINFYTTPDLTDTPVLAMSINEDQSVTFANGAVGVDHGGLTGLADDDHINYFFALGRAGGQSMIGGTNPADGITLQSNTTNTGAGRINMNTPVEFGPYSSSTALYAFNYDAVEVFPGAFIGGGLNMSGTITTGHATFIYESFRGAPNVTTAVAPGFAAYTMMQALPQMNAGPTTNPLNISLINGGPSTRNAFASVRTSANVTGFNFSPSVVGALNGATMNVTNIQGLIVAPKWNTVAGSTVSFGTVRGLWVQAPTQALFGSSAGAENITAYYGIDVQNNVFGGGSRIVNAMRSNLAAATNVRFLNNINTAESEFGTGHIHFNDNGIVKFGNTLAAADSGIYFDGVDLVLDTQITGANASKTVVLHGIRVEADVFPVSDFIRRTASTNLLNSSWRLSGVTTGDMADGFGTALFWSIEDDAAVRQNIAFFSAERAGADNSGLYRLRVYDAGVPRQVYEASRNTMTITSRAKAEVLAVSPISPAQITADVDDYQGQGLYTLMRGMLRLSTDASRIMSGIDATTADYSEADDMLWLINFGSFDLVLGHQDTGSLAANRIISPTGVDLILGPDESAHLWYDGTTARWRILETTGA